MSKQVSASPAAISITNVNCAGDVDATVAMSANESHRTPQGKPSSVMLKIISGDGTEFELPMEQNGNPNQYRCDISTLTLSGRCTFVATVYYTYTSSSDHSHSDTAVDDC